MKTTTYSNFRQNLKEHLDNVVRDSDPLYITRKNGEEVVVMSKSDYDSMEETFYLLRSPKNAKRLLDAISDYEAGKGKEHKLIED